MVIRSWESEPSWEVLEAWGSELDTETVLQAEQPRKKRWWWQGGIPEGCFTEGPDNAPQEQLVTNSSAIRCSPRHQTSQVELCLGIWRAPGTCHSAVEQLVFVMPRRVRYLHRLEMGVCLSLWAARWRRQPFNHLCLKNKPLSEADQTCFHPTHVCQGLATSI